MKEYVGKLFDKIAAIDITDYSQSVSQSARDYGNQKIAVSFNICLAKNVFYRMSSWEIYITND